MLPPCATARGVSPAAVAAPPVSLQPSVRPTSCLAECARKLLRGMVGGRTSGSPARSLASPSRA
eukprot:856730-Pleurochrysis_carterae.AAC.1